jgi:hypothetical protein
VSSSGKPTPSPSRSSKLGTPIHHVHLWFETGVVAFFLVRCAGASPCSIRCCLGSRSRACYGSDTRYHDSPINCLYVNRPSQRIPFWSAWNAPPDGLEFATLLSRVFPRTSAHRGPRAENPDVSGSIPFRPTTLFKVWLGAAPLRQCVGPGRHVECRERRWRGPTRVWYLRTHLTTLFASRPSLAEGGPRMSATDSTHVWPGATLTRTHCWRSPLAMDAR